MKALNSIFILLFASLFLSESAIADSARSKLKIRVLAVDKLEVTNGGEIKLGNSSGKSSSGKTIWGPASDTTARLSFVHNSHTPMKITAEATNVSSGHDITLKLEVPGGAGVKTLIVSGKSNSIQSVYSGRRMGARQNVPMTYTATCTQNGMAATEIRDFGLTITYTSLEDG